MSPGSIDALLLWRLRDGVDTTLWTGLKEGAIIERLLWRPVCVRVCVDFHQQHGHDRHYILYTQYTFNFLTPDPSYSTRWKTMLLHLKT